MRELTLHLLDIAENSISAHARNITIIVEEDPAGDRLRMSVQDDGKGMDEDLLARVTDPFTTTRTTRKVGLGIPLLKAAAEACRGGMDIQSEKGKGTCLRVEFQRSHIDRMPLGDLAGTFLTLLIGSPEVHWIFRYRAGEREFEFDDAPFKQELGDEIPLTEPPVLCLIRGVLEEGISEIQPTPAPQRWN